MDYNDKLTEIFFHVDEFCLEFDNALQSHLITQNGKRPYKERATMIGANLLKDIFGKLFGDKGYISEQLTNALFVDGIHLITKIKRNMKNRMMKIEDKILLRKRALIESVNDELKNICQIEHTRHRSFANFITNIIGGMAAYSFMPKKPAISYQRVKETQLSLF